MVFGTLDFAIFLPVVFGLYWTVFAKRLRAQNAFLVLASYVFYGWWDWLSRNGPSALLSGI
jgi:alginate O-acetyltransferase complex protein AlgI